MAWKLAEAGCKVTILEAGGRVDRAQAVERYRRSPVKDLDAPYLSNSLAPYPILSDLESHLRQQGPELFMGAYLRQVGGTTWHWLGTAMRLLPEDFQMRRVHGVGRDWPISYQELERWYEAAEVCMGVSGPTHPMPAIRQATTDKPFELAAEALGLSLRPLPQARNSMAYDGRPRCCGSASCVPICPVGAKYDATVHVDKAVKAGARLLDNHVVTGLEVDSSGRVISARFLRDDGTTNRQSGAYFVVAAHSVETPRLLLNSSSERFPSGLANSSGQVGRNLMGGSAMMSWGLAPEPVYPYRAPQATSGIFDFRRGRRRREESGFVTTVATDGWPAGQPGRLVEQFLARGLKGTELRQALSDHVSRQVALVSTVEQLPEARNRIGVAPDWLDSAGLPRPAVDYHGPCEYARKGLERAGELHQKLFALAGITEPTHSVSVDPAFILGTTRMGEDSKDSVVDRDLRCHDHPNLYLVGGSVFPTTGMAPPTLTVAALALRAAGHLLAKGVES